jgi:hypothetical protein
MGFIIVLIVSALLLAGSAAFFSVYGLGQVFSGAFLSVVIMGSALELGKLVASSFLYRFWDKISIALKTYMLAAVISLMLITSLGISGYLTSAYQTDTVTLRQQTTQLTFDKEELARLDARKVEIDKQIADMPPKSTNAKQRLIKTFKDESDKLMKRRDDLQAEITKFNSTTIAGEAQVGPVIFISKVLNTSTDNAVFYLMLLLVLVFDPLAVALTLAVNIALKHHQENKPTVVPSNQPLPIKLDHLATSDQIRRDARKLDDTSSSS